MGSARSSFTDSQKSDRDNLRRIELSAMRARADEMLRLDEAYLDAVMANGAIGEVICDG